MPRIARIIALGFPHHVAQRGNRREDVFGGNGDRREYLMAVTDYKDRCGLDIRACCLMSNHVHFVAAPRRADSFGRTLKPRKPGRKRNDDKSGAQ